MIVADTNLIAYLLIPGERSTQAREIFRRDREWCAPWLWRSEFRNVLALYLRQKLLSLAQAEELAREAENLMNGGEYSVTAWPVLALAARSGCSAYDCEFVALAQDLGVPLITSDRKVLQGFPEYARSPEQFLNE